MWYICDICDSICTSPLARWGWSYHCRQGRLSCHHWCFMFLGNDMVPSFFPGDHWISIPLLGPRGAEDERWASEVFCFVVVQPLGFKISHALPVLVMTSLKKIDVRTQTWKKISLWTSSLFGRYQTLAMSLFPFCWARSIWKCQFLFSYADCRWIKPASIGQLTTTSRTSKRLSPRVPF